MGMGIEQLQVLKNLTPAGLYDVESLATVGTAAVDYAFVLGLVTLAIIALAAYVIGAARFCKRDLPL